VTLRTWHVEGAVVAAVLAGTVVATGGGWTAWLGAMAVQLSFHHAAIADRMTEVQNDVAYLTRMVGAQGIYERWHVRCWRSSRRLFIGKELCWLVYFAATRSWPALAGVFVFLAYPLWRAWWRRRHPRQTL
jgi:hypothetical protein